MTASADPTRHRASSCDGKQSFASHKLASKVATKRNRNNDKARSAYRCLFCCQWHLGTDVNSTTRRIKAEVRKRKEHYTNE